MTWSVQLRYPPNLTPRYLREVISAYHSCVAEEVCRLDGFVAKYMGDGVLVYFGLEGELRCIQGASPAEAEPLLQTALTIARDQSARSLELRAAISLARFWRNQGKQAEVRDLLGSVYNRFTEGFDSLDLKEARASLTALAS